METILDKIIDRKKEIALGSISVFVGMAILIGYFQSGPDSNDYAQAEASFAKWEAAPTNEQFNENMKRAIQRAPALKKKYEARLAQKLIDLERVNEAAMSAYRSVDRVGSSVPFHASFGQCSLLIEQKSFQKALESAVALKEEMERTFTHSQLSNPLFGGSVLYAHNLVRIACLQQELKNQPGEQAAWIDLKSYMKGAEEISLILLDTFSDHDLNLSKYMSERQKAL